MKGGDLDGFELWLHDLLERCLGRGVLRHVRVSFEQALERTVCRIDVAPADSAVFLRPRTGDKRPELHVRTGNSTRELAIDDAIDYVRYHWPESVGSRARVALQRLARRGG